MTTATQTPVPRGRRVARPLPWAAALAIASIAAGADVPKAADPAEAPKTAAKPENVEPGWLERRWATTDLTALAAALGAWRQEHGSWPSDCPREAAARLSPSPGVDPWGSAYTCALDGVPSVVSAGPDKSPGTADDLVYRLDGQGLVKADGATTPPAASTPKPPAATAEGPAAPATDEAKVTTDRLVWLARALESFRSREHSYPVADKAEYLERWLVPQDLPASQWMAEDAWGHEWRYRVTDVGGSYSLSSSGADGRWESLVPPATRANATADGDLVVADGRFVRWPSGYRPDDVSPGAERRPSEMETHEPEPADKSEATRWRMDKLAALVERRREDGHYPESDDAARLFGDLGSRLGATDAWGRDLDYLTLAGGRHFALVSKGPDGKLGHAIEDYAAGAAAAGDDIVVRK